MGETDALAIMFVFTVIGGTAGAWFSKADIWKGALVATAGAIVLTLYWVTDAQNLLVFVAASLVAMGLIAGAFKFSFWQIVRTLSLAIVGNSVGELISSLPAFA